MTRRRLEPARLTSAVVLGAAGVAFGATALVFGLRATSFANDASDLRSSLESRSGGTSHSACYMSADPMCSALAADNQKADANTTTAVWLGTAGAGLLVAGIATWFLWPQRATTRAVFVPVVGPREAGGSLVLSF